VEIGDEIWGVMLFSQGRHFFSLFVWNGAGVWHHTMVAWWHGAVEAFRHPFD